MTKNYYYQVIPVLNSCPLWDGTFSYINFGNSVIVHKHSDFLHIINSFINKNLYYENKF